MCGIFGIVTNRKTIINEDNLRAWSDTLFRLSDSRGKEASGIATFSPTSIDIYRQPISGKKLINLTSYKNLFNKDISAFIGHSRLATNGIQTTNFNNQPVFSDIGAVIHNGIIVNDKKIWNTIHQKPKFEVDTEVILRQIEFYLKKRNSVIESVKKTFEMIEGSASIAYLSGLEKTLTLATNTGSLYWVVTDLGHLIFASEEYILNQFLKLHELKTKRAKIINILPGNALYVDLYSGKLNQYSFKSNKLNSLPKLKKITSDVSILEKKDKVIVEPTITILSSVNNSLKLLKKHNFDYKRIAQIRRCTRCILPETMPFISFDRDGVCSYCAKYKKVIYQGRDKLEEILRKYRSGTSKHDCIATFSGGRDSSYGLHYLKKEIGMNPIAYTYDWGMITDLARRNQARLVGKLGVEHIIVSADIAYKRNNIRKNVLAWLNKPDLGMIPLFMVGDKQAEYYVDQVAKQTDIKLVIYFSGCEMENDEFKAAYSGIKNAYPGAILHNMAIPGRLKMASYYARQFIRNPSYINSSIFDTAFGYFSIYMKRHNYLYLWYFIPWNEKQIVSTIKNVYGWETDPNTTLTWRTDDGTPAFYNYIYHQVQGFTENDTFRSNQIREGIITRDEAVRFVNSENLPRYEALKWYFDQIGLDGHKVLSKVDKITKRY